MEDLLIYRCQTLLEVSFWSEEHPIELAKAGVFLFPSTESLLEKGWDVFGCISEFVCKKHQ